jgi:hypothetical protein
MARGESSICYKPSALNLGKWSPSSYKAFCSHYGEHVTDGQGYHCWNKEAMMAHIEKDMSEVWTDLQVYFESRVQTAAEAITEVYDTAIDKSRHSPQNRADTEINTEPTSTSLIQMLRHRRNLTTADTEDAIELFRVEFSNLQVDALAPLRTAFIGNLMEDAYHAANLEFGEFLSFRTS